MNDLVNVWEEDVSIPTYAIGKPEKNPMFLENRVYQGSSGVVYPYPVIEKIEDTCKPQIYHAVYLENEYLKIMILPELGGRIQMAYDKIKQRHFIYYNQVIKPALVGLTGPWISGGIEFNWPQHHRPSTFLPIDFTIERLPDGGATVWVNEQERMFHQKGMAGFTLRPKHAVLEIKGKLFNPTPLPQTFLWWANPAVAVNDHYQSVFPDDVHAVFDHGKRDVSKYPIATGTYYKMDYSAGVDISRYKNIPVPTSYMAIQSKYDFVGGYENDTQAGLLHVANHHISPGKKQWTWGNSDFGQAWDRNLTDEDGPYIELMTGMFTDNQPDFSWLQPYEEKTFTQYFMPYRELGVIKNANSELLMNITMEEQHAVLQLFATCAQHQLHITAKQEGTLILDTHCDVNPEHIFKQIVPCTHLHNLEVNIYRSSGKLHLSWKAASEEVKEIPDAAQAALEPSEIQTTEQLYLTGLHLEQYRHATYCPLDYYNEALKRDPHDSRNNNAKGLWLLRRGQFNKAEYHFRIAVRRLTERNPNPYDGEALYNLGLALKYQGKGEEAYDFFYKASWNAAWQDAAYYSLAQLSSAHEMWSDALHEINQSLIRNWHNHRARHLKTIILKHLDLPEQALSFIEASLLIDPFNFGCLFERYLITHDAKNLDAFLHLIRKESNNFEELITDYCAAGCWREALQIANLALAQVAAPNPMLLYYKAWILTQLQCTSEAVDTIILAELEAPNCCFPNRLEAIGALQCAIQLHANTPKAHYYLGNLWYDKRQYVEATKAWEQSMHLDPQFPTVLRNLALAYFNKWNDPLKADELLEKAFLLDCSDARILMELDQLHKKRGHPHQERFDLLDKHKEVVWKRDDLYLEYITLLNQMTRYQEALNLIMQRQFHPWEGGEGKVTAQYQLARMELAKTCFQKNKYAEALDWIEGCFSYPHNLGEGKLYGAQENDFNYYKACAMEGLGQTEEAQCLLNEASTGNSEPAAAIFYNDQKPDKIYYQGLALRKLNREPEARSRFNKLLSYGEKHLYDTFKMDYFAVSLPDLQIWEEDMNKKNKVHCYYLMALGHQGLGHFEKANACFEKAFSMDINHQGVHIHILDIDATSKT